MVASRLAATVVTAILRCDFCAAKTRNSLKSKKITRNPRTQWREDQGDVGQLMLCSGTFVRSFLLTSALDIDRRCREWSSTWSRAKSSARLAVSAWPCLWRVVYNQFLRLSASYPSHKIWAIPYDHKCLHYSTTVHTNITDQKKTNLGELPSDTKLLLTKNDSEIIKFWKIANLTRNFLKMPAFPGHFESTKWLKNYEK